MSVIGVDIGTQSLKAIVLDSDFVPRGEASIPYRPSFPAPSWAEQDPSLWLRALRPAIAGVLARSGLRPADIKGLAVSGQLDGCLPADANGKALAPCIIWMDRRAVDEIARVDPQFIRERTGLVLDATHMAAKIRWMRKHLPETRNAAMWHQPVSFIVASLCGRAVMDHALASTTMLYGLSERIYSGELLELFEIDGRQLPELDKATAAAGTLSKAGAALTGLAAGTPVSVGTGDDFASPIGAGVVAPGLVTCSLGTAEVVGAVSDWPHIDKESLVETHGFLGDRFLVNNPGWLSGGAITWFLSTFGVSTAGELSALAGQAPAGCDGLTFLPALSGAMAPRWDAGARGAFYGLTAAHGKAACARALLEGCAFAMRDVVDRMTSMGVATDRIRLCGGGAKSRVWAQIRADLCLRPVEVTEVMNASPLGAALLASVTAGLAGSVDEAVSRMPLRLATVEPDPAKAEKYETAYCRYRTLFDALAPLYAG
jgi:xylulokinase